MGLGQGGVKKRSELHWRRATVSQANQCYVGCEWGGAGWGSLQKFKASTATLIQCRRVTRVPRLGAHLMRRREFWSSLEDGKDGHVPRKEMTPLF